MESRVNSVTIIGAGYVGGCTAAVMASRCPRIMFTVVDIDENRIRAWNGEELPIYEPGLYELVTSVRGRNLFFSNVVGDNISRSQLVFIAVNTPTKTTGMGSGYDLTAYESAAITIAQNTSTDLIVVEKSTVPVKTAEKILQVMNANRLSSSIKFSILSNPEFLAEGTAIGDLINPDRVIIGGEDVDAIRELMLLYTNWVPLIKIITVNTASAEIAKLAANAFLAQKISSINSLSELCEITGANIGEVARVVGSDSRIGMRYLNASVGFGGSCFRKDLLGLVYLCEHYGMIEVANYWRAVLDMNKHQQMRFCKKILLQMFGTLKKKKIAIFGFTYKKNTADIRDSIAIDVAKFLINEGAFVCVYDPKAGHRDIIAEVSEVLICPNPYIAAKNAHAVVIMTEWDEFKGLDYHSIYKTMQKPAFLFDGRRLLDAEELENIGFCVYRIGE